MFIRLVFLVIRLAGAGDWCESRCPRFFWKEEGWCTLERHHLMIPFDVDGGEGVGSGDSIASAETVVVPVPNIVDMSLFKANSALLDISSSISLNNIV